MDTRKDWMTRDVRLILAGQKAHHDGITSDGGLITRQNHDVTEVMAQTLEEGAMPN